MIAILCFLVTLAAHATTITTTASSSVQWRDCWGDSVTCLSHTDSASQSGTDSAAAISVHGNLGYGRATASATATTLSAYGSGSGNGGDGWPDGERFMGAGGSASATLSDVIFSPGGSAAFLRVVASVGGTSWDGGPSWASWNIGGIQSDKGATIGGWNYTVVTTVPIAVSVAITGRVVAAAGVSGGGGGAIFGGSDYSSASLSFLYTFLDVNLQPVVADVITHHPEPASIVLMVAGMVMIAVRRRKPR